MARLVDLVTAFLRWSEASGYAPDTVRVRKKALEDFCAWCRERSVTAAGEVTRPMLLRYQRHLFDLRQASGKPLSWSSQHGRMVAVRGFFRWATMESYILYNPASELHLPRRPHRLPKAVLSVSEVEAVLAAPEVGTVRGLRDRALLEVLYSTGLRRMEVIGLEVFDVDLRRGLVRVEQGKGSRDRVVPVGQRACAWVSRYLAEGRPELVVDPAQRALFVADGGRAFHPQYLSRLVRRYVEAAGIEKSGSCHLFRHTAATLMLENGADIRFIQQLLGHAEISTTQIYTQVSIQALQEVHTRTHPGAALRRREDAGREIEAEELLGALEAEELEEAVEEAAAPSGLPCSGSS
ncbi:MAG: site-specific tyrosine recombinase XerC [Acidobacteriota bacterium]|nr:site-specific tyrosine recombinase XerC [Acidobacteriota bacterium]